MAKDERDVLTEELELGGGEGVAPRRNRHVEVALSHMRKRLRALETQQAKLQLEIDGLDVAIKALE